MAVKGASLRRGLYAWVVFVMFLAAQPAAADDVLEIGDYAGKVVVVDFWASWCVPCRRSFPWLNAMQDKYADEGLVVIGVNLDNDLDDARKFLQEYPASFEIVYDEDRNLARSYEVIAMPSSFLIGRDGGVLERHLGFKVMRQNEYEAAIISALGQER